jgi:hypothetical protein
MMAEAISAINKVLKEWKCSEASPAKLDVSTEQLNNHEIVLEKIHNFKPNQGWICFTDKVAAFYSASELEALGNGTILSGELAKENESVHIRQSGSGWTVIHYAIGIGADCLMLPEEYISTENKQLDRLKYEVYWKKDDSGCYRPWAGRFAGFVKGGNAK